ncbi:unnamed protein product [Didymodactylos carnosus]|uniref:Cysteine and tyrosine-rich protein 1 n=1 Tax=Didymodactylos carnosus TaxID=1234261 RepID=A0A815FRV1_9BILA|nr:unnamed protein product [Didymodactylos carnosus]CAF1327434.1 unnamed protein product [Didymodactylos carnosus]CAF3963854.1 unnamed protein product [Didymodactylos carnosus]CAF4178254.1 unnamed protein product [Didymodactylos carnosus]
MFPSCLFFLLISSVLVTKCYSWCDEFVCYSTTLSTAGIVGIVIGSLVGLSLFITCIVCICRSIARSRAQQPAVMVQYPVGSGGIVYPNQPSWQQGYPNPPPQHQGYPNQPPQHQGYPYPNHPPQHQGYPNHPPQHQGYPNPPPNQNYVM